MTPGELEGLPNELVIYFRQLEEHVMSDIVRRLKNNGNDVIRSADWQIHRLAELGKSGEEIKAYIQNALKLSENEADVIFQKAINQSYVYDKEDYVGAITPFAENEELKQFAEAIRKQTSDELKNITQSMGFAVRQSDGTLKFLPIADYYQRTLDGAMLDITSGTFDYNTVLKRIVSEMVNSGLRTVDYASGHFNRIDVAARRAVMTGVSQFTGRINEDNAAALGTETFEVSWHSGARPSHMVWQGKWYTKSQLESICGLGSVTGLCGANCYHSYTPVIPGISMPTYTAEELERMNAEELTTKKYGDKQYTKYEALQKQRKTETSMRAQRQKIKLLKEGGADENDIITARCRYRAISAEYTRFSSAMDLPQQRERVYIDGLGSIGKGKYTKSKKMFTNSTDGGIIKIDKQRGIEEQMDIVAEKHTAAGNRRSPYYVLTEQDIEQVKEEIKSIGADVNDFVFNSNSTRGTCFLASDGKVHIKGNIFPDEYSEHPRDKMSVRAVLAHEYYGHKPYRTQYLKEDNDSSPDSISKIMARAWADEFRASYMASKNAPNLLAEDRYLLISDALTRAEEAGIKIKYNAYIRRVLYDQSDNG